MPGEIVDYNRERIVADERERIADYLKAKANEQPEPYGQELLKDAAKAIRDGAHHSESA